MELLMNKFLTQVKRFAADEEGATAIEYGLLAGLISVVIIAGVTAVGTNLEAVFQYISTKLTVPAAG
jgi:pilus assembly protein Flp/PilA